jgi:hypothetical protein
MAPTHSDVIVGDTVRDRQQQPLFPSLPRCQHCGEIIGVYEPLVLVREGAPHTTSIAAEARLFPTVHACYHGACYEHRASSDRAAA